MIINILFKIEKVKMIKQIFKKNDKLFIELYKKFYDDNIQNF